MALGLLGRHLNSNYPLVFVIIHIFMLVHSNGLFSANSCNLSVFIGVDFYSVVITVLVVTVGTAIFYQVMGAN